MNILLIDDESGVTDAIKDNLTMFSPNRSYGRILKIDVANNFYDARELLDSGTTTYNLIISDLLLPRLGADIPDSYQGRTLTGWFFLYHHILKQEGTYHDKYKDTTIVLFSAYEEIWEQYLKDNGLEYLKNNIISVPKGHTYNDTGSYKALIDKLNRKFA